MNRSERRALDAENRKWPTFLRQVPRRSWPKDGDERRAQVWRSRDWLVQVFDEAPGFRVSVCRTSMRPDGRWKDGITWDELQQVKGQIGIGDRWAVEIYPPDGHVVDDANMRQIEARQQ